jgi:hypothetical protein
MQRQGEGESELRKALSVLGWKEDEVLAERKGSPRKQVLAWWLRRRTVVGRRWIAQRLQMGHETRVTSATVAVKNARRDSLARWRRALEDGAKPT